MSKIYKYKGEDISEEFVTEGFEQSSFTILDDYITNTDGLEVIEEVEDFQNGTVGTDAPVVPVTPSRASIIAGVEPESMELEQVDTSLELEDPEPVISASKKRIATRKRREQEKQDRLKAEAILATNEIETRIQNLPEEDIVAIQANDYFGPIKNIDDKKAKLVTTPGMFGGGTSVIFEPTFDSDESYTKYLKETLGGKYDQYLDYKKTNKIVPLNSQNQSELEGIYNEAETQAKDKIYNNSLFNVSEDVQEYMVVSPDFASGAESKEAQEFLVKGQEETLRKNIESYKTAKKEWESQALPLNEEIKDIKTEIDRFTFYSGGASQEQADQYNELIQIYNAKIQQWEEKGFNELPAFVNSQYKLVNSQQEDYSKMLDDSRKALISADLFEKNLKQDYSASARVGRVFDEFFVQSTRNFLDLTAELVLRAAPIFQPLAFLSDSEYSEKVDSLIQTIQKNNKNYNLGMASKRENIPTSPSIDDIGKDGLSIWDWTAIALQDNSATLATTFIPTGAAIKGAAGVSKAFKTASYAARKKALQNQKKLWLAGKRTVQGTFFVAETGGKYGELQTDEASRDQEIKFLYSKLDNTEDIDERTNIYNKITELEEVEDYSLLQKAFTSYGAGTTATLLETLGTLKMLEPAKGLAKQIGVKAAKKELYKQPVRFGANLVGKTLAGLKSLPKNLGGEVLEEVLTEVSHNALDITVLDENKSMFEGVNKDFLASTAISSFGIMAPRSAGNMFNIVKSEFRTKDEIFNNQKLTRELIDLNESTTPENSKQLRGRKRQILKELALSDAISLHKLRYMTADQIEEVADINRQMRQVDKKSRQLGSLGDLGEAENKRVKKQLEEEYSNLAIARQEILDAKQRSNTEKAANINKALGDAARNSESAFYYGLNDFYNEVTMTQMGDGDFISIKSEIQNDGSIKYENLDEQFAKYKNKTIKDENGNNVNALEYLKEKTEQGYFNAVKIGKDIVVNQAVIDKLIALAPTSAGAQYAAIAPLEELFHLSVAQKGIKFDSTARNAVLEAEEILKEKRELGVISEKNYDDLKKRFDQYRDGKDFDAEEFIAQINNAVALGAINRSDIESIPSFKKFLNNTIRSTFGDMSWMLKLENSDDVFNLVKNFQADVSKGVTFQAPEDDEVKESRSEESSQEVQRIYEEQGEAGAFDIIEQFKPIVNKIVEQRSQAPNFDRQLLTDEIETGKRGIFDLIREYKPESGVPLAAYINKFLPARAIEASRRVLGEEFTEDVAEARGVVAEAAPAEVVEERVTRKIKPTSLIPAESVTKIKEQVTEKIKEIPADKLSFKKLGDLAPEVIAEAIGIPVKKLVDPKANLSKGDASAIQRFVNKNADRLLKLLPEGAVLEAATEKLIGTSTGVPKGLLNAFYTKQERIGKGAGLAPFKKNPNITKADFLKAFGIVEGKKAEDFSARSPEAQALKGIANLYGRLVTNEIVRTETDLDIETKQDIAAGKARLMFSKAIEKSTSKEFLDKKISSQEKTSISNSVRKVLIGKNTKDALMIELSDSILRKVEDSKNMGQILDAMFSEPEKLLSIRQAREFQAKLITAVQDSYSQDQNIRSLVYSAANSIKTFFKYQREIIGYGYIKNKLKQDLKSAKTKEKKVQLLKEFLVFGSRSIRTSKIDGITTNKAIFNKIIKPLINSDNDLKDFDFFTKKGRSYITYKGNIIKGLSSIYDIKNNFEENIGLIDLEADISREYVIKQIDEARKNNDIDGVIAMLALLTSDQRGALRKSSKAGFYVDDASVKDYILEHEMEAYEIHKAYVNYAKDGGVDNLNNILNDSYVNSIPKSLDKILNENGVKERNIDRYKRPEFLKELQKLYDEGLLKNIDPSRYGIKFSKASKLDKTFNDILEKKSDIPSRKRYGIVEAITKGANKGRFNFFIPPSAEDFVGLLYPTLAKGKVGDAQMSWYKKNLIDPYAEAMNKLSKARVFLMNNYNSLKKQLGIVPKNLSKKIEGTDYTREQAIRVYIWNKQKMNIPGISDKDISQLSNYVADDTNLQAFADQLINMQLGDGYVKPKEGWPAGTITTDILEGLNTTKRAKYLNKWQENVDAIFSEENLNKLQAIYGLNYRKALENMLKRMKSGRNRSFPGDSLTGRFTDWLTGSVGAIMFFNTRSAILQTISSINFINFTDNNILAAGKAFANQKQYWSDFMKLINSDFLKERRGGLRINVNEADIADMAKKGGVKGAISKLLELGFAPTQIADSFAIASGGATFYRNRIKTYKKQGLSDKQAEKKAFEDFRETAEESQQSSRADRISMQQAGPLGRVILAFANTPAQYARIIKKAASDLKNGRGDAKTNISKIIYYGAVQNLIFNALQQALFAIGFGDEEPEDEEKQKKYISIANGMLDSILRGAGIGGAIVSVGKNAIIKLTKELEKDRPKLQNIASEIIKISPPVSAKYSRLVQAGKSYDWNKEEMKEKGLSLDNPAYLAGANVVSALTNIPLDRVIKKANNVVSATSQDLETWERLALLGGWQDWEIGVEKESKSNKPQPRKIVKKKVIRKKLAK